MNTWYCQLYKSTGQSQLSVLKLPKLVVYLIFRDTQLYCYAWGPNPNPVQWPHIERYTSSLGYPYNCHMGNFSRSSNWLSFLAWIIYFIAIAIIRWMEEMEEILHQLISGKHPMIHWVSTCFNHPFEIFEVSNEVSFPVMGVPRVPSS